MKLNLGFAGSDAAAAIYAVLRFSRLDVAVLPEVFDKYGDLEHLPAYPQKDGVPLYLSLDTARAAGGSLASLHVHKSFAIMWVGENIRAIPVELTRGMDLYCFADDRVVINFLSDSRYHCIEHIHSFWQDKSPLKLLLVSSRQTCDVILSGDPESFVHTALSDTGLLYSLAGELYAYRDISLHRMLLLLCALNPPVGEIYPIAAMRGALSREELSYSFFADHYDEHMSHVVYDLWVDNLIHWQDTYAADRGKKCLELACGTANISSRMVLTGYQADACDLSTQMLINADKKELKPSLYQASLTDPIPQKDYDLIFCLFDSINYLNSGSEVITCLTEVSKALHPGGIFIFDISTLQNSLANFADTMRFDESESYSMVHEAYYETYNRTQVSRLTCFESRGPVYSLQRELHRQRVYLCSEIIDFIHHSPLKLLAIHSSQGKANLLHKKPAMLDKHYQRLFFITGLNAGSVSK